MICGQNGDSKWEMARSALQQRDWPYVCWVALSATGQSEATSPAVYTNWVEQDYGSTADCDCVYYRMYCWFVHFHTTGHPLHLQSICLPGQEERDATGMPDGPSTWQSWVPVSESKYTLVRFLVLKMFVYIHFRLCFWLRYTFRQFHFQASIHKSNYNSPVRKYIHSMKRYYLNKCS